MCTSQDAALCDARPVVGFKDVATVTRSGLIMTIDRTIRHRLGTTRLLRGGRVLQQQSTANGYISVSIPRHNKRHNRSIAKIVAEAWIRPIAEGERVRHRDFDTSNNHVSNLIIVDRSEARTYSPLKSNKRCRLQRKAEIWRDIPHARAAISNFGRLRSNATATASILTPVAVDTRRIVAFINSDGVRTSSTVGHLMRSIFPELASEYQHQKRKPKCKAPG